MIGPTRHIKPTPHRPPPVAALTKVYKATQQEFPTLIGVTAMAPTLRHCGRLSTASVRQGGGGGGRRPRRRGGRLGVMRYRASQ